MSLAKFRKVFKGNKKPNPPSPKVSPVGTVTESMGLVESYEMVGTIEDHGLYLNVALSTKKS